MFGWLGSYPVRDFDVRAALVKKPERGRARTSIDLRRAWSLWWRRRHCHTEIHRQHSVMPSDMSSA
eukprot:6452853-Amphidinium_carterae.1